MKKISSFIALLLCFYFSSQALNPAFTFAPLSANKTEGTGTNIVSYVKANNAVTTTTTVQIAIQSGFADSVQINKFTTQTLTFNAGVDSLPFTLTLPNDTLVEGLSTVVFVLQNPSASSTIGVDSLFTLSIVDNDLPATIRWAVTLDSITPYDVYYPMAVYVNNPNNFCVKYYAQTDIPMCTAIGGWDYSYDWNYHYARPGISYDTVMIHVVVDSTYPNPVKYIIFKIRDYGGNNVTDSMAKIYILDDVQFNPPTISFDYPVDSAWEDTAGIVSIPITVYNPNYKPINFNVIPDFANSTATTGSDFDLPNKYSYFTNKKGISHDTARLAIINDNAVEPTESVKLYFTFKNNYTSTDSTFTFYIIDHDSVIIGFIGAGYTHVESEGTCLVPIVTTSSVPYPISLDVKYLNGNATPGVDFTFNDTTIVFPANSSDTQYVRVTILPDNIYEGNEQINLYISNPNPSFTRLGVLDYTFFIIDDDTSFTSILNISANQGIRIYPNPVSSILNIKTDDPIESAVIINVLGEKIQALSPLQKGNNSIPVNELASGIYFLQMEKNHQLISRKFVKE